MSIINFGDKYEIDEDGNNDLIIRHVDNGTVLKYDAEADALLVEALDVTSEALAEVELTNDQSISKATWTTVDFDNEVTDSTANFDLSADQFTPPEDGYYTVIAQVQFKVGADQDRLGLRFRDVTQGQDEFFANSRASGTAFHTVYGGRSMELTTSSSYELQAKNQDNADTLRGHGSFSYMTVMRNVLA